MSNKNFDEELNKILKDAKKLSLERETIGTGPGSNKRRIAYLKKDDVLWERIFALKK